MVEEEAEQQVTRRCARMGMCDHVQILRNWNQFQLCPYLAFAINEAFQQIAEDCHDAQPDVRTPKDEEGSYGRGREQAV